MKKIEKFTFLFFEFFIFEVLLIRLGFFLKIPISSYTLPISFFFYIFILSIYFLTQKNKTKNFTPLLIFVITSFIFLGLSLLIGKTYDLSWDGQGYHQTAVIALSKGWNPVWQKTINFPVRLPSQVFAEGYPTMSWEIEASIYNVVGSVNSAKIINFIFLLIAMLFTFILLKKIKIKTFLSVFLSFLVCFQPLFINQQFSFMQDGLAYEITIIAISSLIVFILKKKNYWSLISFISAEIFLASSKYSLLPVAGLLGIIFMVIVINRFMNKEYFLNKTAKLFIFLVILVSFIFSWIPYIKNIYFYQTPFYPTNIPALNGSVKYNNLPQNLKYANPIILYVYGIFGRSQVASAGDTRSISNRAYLKLPFTFSIKEIDDASKLFNNRVGATGPLFSGIVLASFIFTIYMSFNADTMRQKYSIYVSFFAFTLITIASLVVPTPNLLRYVSQIELIPFVLLIPILVAFDKNKFTKFFSITIFTLIFINNSLYFIAALNTNILGMQAENTQFEEMRDSGNTFKVKSQEFYSNYTLLTEQNIKFQRVANLPCKKINKLVSSSASTLYCY